MNNQFLKKCIYRGDKEALKYFDERYGSYNEESVFIDKFIDNKKLLGGFNKRYVCIKYNSDYRLNRLYKTYRNRKDKYNNYGFEILCKFDFAERLISDLYTEKNINSFIEEINNTIGHKITFESPRFSINNMTLYIPETCIKYFAGCNVKIPEYIKVLCPSPFKENINNILNKYFSTSVFYIDQNMGSFIFNAIIDDGIV